MPKCLLAISGKRKSGKDYCAKLIKEALERNRVSVEVVGISNSLKMEYSKMHDLDFTELLTDKPYKEMFRKDMIKWGEDIRSKDSGRFCRAAISSVSDNDVIIVSDCRRPTDYEFFTKNYKTLTVRIEASEEHRKQRGFQFTNGVDDTDSECGLDNSAFDFVLKNQTGEKLTPQIEIIIEQIFRTINET